MVQQTHMLPINTVKMLPKGLFLTVSDDRSLKIWKPLETEPVAFLLEEDAITDAVVLETAEDTLIVYVLGSVLRCLSLKQGAAKTILSCDRLITAITKVAGKSTIVSFGQENGLIQEFDVKKGEVFRSENVHNGSRITSIISKGKYLISGSEDGLIVVYDHQSEMVFRELKTAKMNLKNPRFFTLLENDKHLLINDQDGLTVLDIWDV